VSDETALAYRQAQQDYRQAPGEADPAELLAAAGAHLAASRPLEDIKAEYDELQAARWERGEATDTAREQELADELAPVAEATQNLAGNLPGTAHAVSAATEIGGLTHGLG
jgi:hypothetical protein